MPDAVTNFIAGYVSGAVGIIIGNPLDIVKVKLQNANRGRVGLPGTDRLSISASFNPLDIVAPPDADAARASAAARSEALARARAEALAEVLAPPKPKVQWYSIKRAEALLTGAAAPILGYGALNALLFASYSISTRALEKYSPIGVSEAGKTFAAGTLAGLSTFVVSCPTELVKCRAQVSQGGSTQMSSWTVAKDIYRHDGLPGFFKGGVVTAVRDGFGYGVYFWSYNWAKKLKNPDDQTAFQHAMHLLMCGGFAGCMTWLSIFPLDVIKTRYQVQLTNDDSLDASKRYRGAWDCARKTYVEGGVRVFFSGLRACMLRAFLVNAVQFGTYEWMLRVLNA
ncbi:mitochondrial carrier domain-containing protein [Limtongia smithiae]|uniref:mitochondrial carrier domain-containing protein n=1 Tax=Limtongia smithiae TaxID=1125753 RepID=UPI0034CEA9B6